MNDEIFLLYPVVPEGNRIDLPAEAYLVIRILTYLMEEERQDGI